MPGLSQPPGTVGLSLVTHCRSCGRPDWRFFQSISRTPLHSVQGSPLPPQKRRAVVKKPRPMQEVLRRMTAAPSA